MKWLLCSLVLLSVVGCSPTQLATADKQIGGVPLATCSPLATTQPTATDLTIHLAGDAATAAQPYAALIPPPYGNIVGGVLTLVAIGATIYGAKQSSTAGVAHGVIANAAGDISELFQGKVSTMPTALRALMNHPAAVAAKKA